MPSFDAVSKIEFQEVDNAVNLVHKEMENRYDFKSVKWSLTNEKKEKQITIIGENDYCLGQLQNSLKGAFVRRKIDPRALDFQKTENASGGTLRQTVKIKEGIEQEIAKKITKEIKSSKLKVQVSIQGLELRVSGKQRDDLQEAMQFIQKMDLPLPIQFINFRD